LEEVVTVDGHFQFINLLTNTVFLRIPAKTTWPKVVMEYINAESILLTLFKKPILLFAKIVLGLQSQVNAGALLITQIGKSVILAVFLV